VGWQLDHVGAVDQHPPVGRLLEARHHAQRRRLAAAAGAEQGEELARRQLEAQLVDGDDLAEALGDRIQLDAGPLVACRVYRTLLDAVPTRVMDAVAPLMRELWPTRSDLQGAEVPKTAPFVVRIVQ
jgi:hypothetical protein